MGIRKYLKEEKIIPGYKTAPGNCGECEFSNFKLNGRKWELICGHYSNVKALFGTDKDPIHYVGILGTTPPELVVDRNGYCPKFEYGGLMSKKMGYHKYEEGNK